MWEKIRKLPNVTKGTITCDIGTAQCEDRTIKYEDLITCYNRSLISGYRTPKKDGVW